MWLMQLPTLYYLIPSLMLALLIRVNCRSFRLFAAFLFVGVFIHETLHLIAGAALGAKPVGMSVIPKRGQQGTMEPGSVCFSNTTWYNALPLALAPLFGLPITIATAYWRVNGGWAFQWTDIPIWMGLASVLLSCWPIYLAVGAYLTWANLPFA